MNYGMEPPPYDPDHQHPPPHGWKRVTFTGGGSLDGQTRLVRISVSEGDDYNLIGTNETYSWDGTQFVLQNPDIEWPDGHEEATVSETETETTEAEPETDGEDSSEEGSDEEADGDAEPE